MSKIDIRIFQLEHGHGLPLPSYGTPDSSGLDLIAAVQEDLTITPGHRALVPTGITIALPQAFEAQIRPRSGLAAKHGITVLNTPGTIDSDYRGEICVVLINLGQEDFTVTRGMRIAQMVLAPVVQANLIQQLHPLEHDTARADGGFGSTGLHAKG